MDRLFREGADKYEVKPSAAAWEAIQGQVGTKTSAWPMIWKVAAVLVVLISSVLVLLNEKDQTSEYLTGIADFPQLTGEALVWSLPEVAKSTDQTVAVEAPTSTRPIIEEVRESIEIVIPEGEMRPYLELQRIQVAWEIEMPSTPALFTVPIEETSVKIRYYASSSAPEKTKKSFGQFIARAQQKLSPDELLADIRTAKDDLFRSNRGD